MVTFENAKTIRFDTKFRVVAQYSIQNDYEKTLFAQLAMMQFD